MGTYSDPALILPGAVGQTEVDATLKRNTANGVCGLNAGALIDAAQLLDDNFDNLILYAFDGSALVGTWVWNNSGSVTVFASNINGNTAGWFGLNIINAEYEWTGIMLPPGTYRVHYIHALSVGGGQAQLYQDGVAMGAVIESYAGSATYDNDDTRDITVTKVPTRISIIIPSKHASSTSYDPYLQKLYIERLT